MGQGSEGFERQIGFFAGFIRRIAKAARRFDRKLNRFQVLRAARLDGFADQMSLRGTAVIHRINQWQGRLAFGQVVANILAELFGLCVIVERVVD